MKKHLLPILSVMFSATVFAAQVDRVLVRQQWPMSPDVRVEYSVSGASAPVAVSFTFYDGETVLTPTDMSALQGDTAYAGNGMHIVTFDPAVLFGTYGVRQFSDFRVKVTLGEEHALMSDKLYRIVDLDTGKVTDLTRADFYNNKGYGAFETDFSVFGSGGWNTKLENVLIWTGVTNNPVYKTSKIVMRYITAKDYGPWTMGSDSYTSSTPAHQVTLTNDYWLSVFELTQAQLYKLTGQYGYLHTSDEGHELMPVFGRWDTVYGRPNTWPNGLHDVSMSSFFKELRTLTGNTIAFDFPTEAQWEFACRAGTDTLYYTGLADNTDRALLGFRLNNGAADIPPSTVGCYLPNAFGLYDMYSNAAEWCLDWFESYDSAAVIDPIGPDSGKNRIQRGTAFAMSYSSKTSATIYRSPHAPNTNSNPGGCRLWCPAE